MDAGLIWLIVGAVLILSEVIIPGGIVIFLGLSAVLVAGLVKLGVITDMITAFLTWFICSIFAMFVLRSFFMKYFEGDSRVQGVDEDADVIGSPVEVIEDISSKKNGRIKFHETTWPAKSNELLTAGTSAFIAGRDGNTYIVRREEC